MATITAKELAVLAGTDAKRMRSFIRSSAKTGSGLLDACGQGNRYAIDVADASAIVAAFKASNRTHASQAAPRSLAELRALLAEAEAAEAAEAEDNLS